MKCSDWRVHMFSPVHQQHRLAPNLYDIKPWRWPISHLFSSCGTCSSWSLFWEFLELQFFLSADPGAEECRNELVIQGTCSRHAGGKSLRKVGLFTTFTQIDLPAKKAPADSALLSSNQLFRLKHNDRLIELRRRTFLSFLTFQTWSEKITHSPQRLPIFYFYCVHILDNGQATDVNMAAVKSTGSSLCVLASAPSTRRVFSGFYSYMNPSTIT